MALVACEQGAPFIDESAMVQPVAREEPEPPQRLRPAEQEEELIQTADDPRALRAEIYATLSAHVTALVDALPDEARLAVAPVYGPEAPEDARALTDLIATLAHRNGAALIHPVLTVAAFADFGFEPAAAEHPKRLVEFGRMIGAEIVVLPRVPRWQGDEPEEDVFELQAFDVRRGEPIEEAARRVAIQFEQLAGRAPLPVDEVRALHQATIDVTQLEPFALEVAVLARSSFASEPRVVEPGEPLAVGEYVKLFVRPQAEIRLFAAGIWEEGTLLPLSGEALEWSGSRGDEEFARTLARYELRLEAHSRRAIPQASWMRLDRAGTLTVVLEARREEEGAKWYVPPGSRAYAGARPILWLREAEARERLVQSLVRQQAAAYSEDPPPESDDERGNDNEAAPAVPSATSWSETWRRTAADRRRELVIWGNALVRLATSERQAEDRLITRRLPDPMPQVGSGNRQVRLGAGQRLRLVEDSELTLELPNGYVLGELRLPDVKPPSMQLPAEELVVHRTARGTQPTLTVEPRVVTGLRGAVAMLELDVRE